MKNGKFKRATVVAGALAAFTCTPLLQGQSADAIIDKLVSKGILTEEEAKDLREEADKGFNTAYQVKSGMPDWVTSLRLNGDIRGRFEQFSNDNIVDRNRLRYRMRFGATAVFRDNLEAGFRLTSSEPANDSSSFGGDPISGNTTFNNNGSKKFVYIDLAYGKWTMLDTPDFNSTWTIGKMENPFVFSDMVFDGDYTPEGLAQQFTYHLTPDQDLKLNLGGFLLDEIGSQSEDPWMLGAQIRWDAKWSQKVQSSLGVAALMIDENQNLTNSAVPSINAGNTRVGGTGELAHNFNPLIADASITYNLESFPLYSGPFPIRLGGEVMHNPAAPTRNSGWWAGVFFGKSGKKGTWELSYRYKMLEADAWYEELVDSDFGVVYPGRTINSGAYSSGTNVKGHILRASYSPYDALTLGVTYFLTDLVQDNLQPPSSFSSDTGRLQVDAVWKF